MHIIDEYIVLELVVGVDKKMHLDKGYNYQKQVYRKCFEILLELFQGESDR